MPRRLIHAEAPKDDHLYRYNDRQSKQEKIPMVGRGRKVKPEPERQVISRDEKDKMRRGL